MLGLLLKVLALGIASTASPVIFAVALTLLAGKFPYKRSLAFLLGGIIALFIILTFGFLVGAQVLHFTKGFSPYLSSVDLFLGVIFIFFGILPLLSKKKEKAPDFKEKKSQSPVLIKWLIIGLLLNITNLDAELLFFTEVKEIFQSNTALAFQLLLALLGSLLFILPALLPLVISVLYPKKSEELLKPFGAFIETHGRILAAVIFLIFGTYLIAKGLGIAQF